VKISGIKSKLLLAFITVLVIITGLNVGLAIYLTTQQSEREAFSRLTRQTALLRYELQETTTNLHAIAKKNVAGINNLSDLATLYAKTQQFTTYPEQAAKNERGFLFNKVISLNRLQVVLRTADFSSAAVYAGNELSHYMTTTEAGMSVFRDGGQTLIKTGKNQAGKLAFNNWPNWRESAPPPLITSHIKLVNRPTISFTFSPEQMVVLQIVVPVQAITQTVMQKNITLGSPEGLLVNDPAIATPEMLNQSKPGQNKPKIIGAFVFKKFFDQDYLQQVAQKTGLLPALYSLDGIDQIQIVDMKMKPADLAQWVEESQAAMDRQIWQHNLLVDRESYYQTLALWQFEGKPRLIIGFAQSGASAAQKVRETVTGLISVAGLVLIGGGILGYVLFGRLVKPITALTEAVSRIGLNTQINGPAQNRLPIVSDKLVEIDLRSIDEVGQLTAAFNAMIMQLRHSFVTLEQRVVERTQELQIAKEKAEAANQAKSAFLSNMSHELRTPLNSILGFSNLMRQDPLIPDSQHQNLDIINRSGEYLLRLINDILDMAKIESGRVQLEDKPFDLGAMLHDITDMMRMRAEDNGLQLLFDQTSLFPRYIVGDEARLRQILINLLGNAIKYTQQGSVSLRLGMKQNKISHMLFEIEDTGIGISSEDQQYVFEPFVQVGKRDINKGTGLGLAITHQFVQMMGGSISLQSEPGKGSLFRVELPLNEAKESDIIKLTRAVMSDVAKLAPGQPEYRILIVEDQHENQLLLTKLLETVGFRVKIAENGAQGVELFQSWHPHFIWMDRLMPVMDGMEATRRIRELPDGNEVKIVAVTASVFAEQRIEMLDIGMDDYVRKPYRASEIYDCMAKHLNVKFLYQDSPEPQEPGVTLTPEMLSALPEKLLSELKEALESLEPKRIEAVIQQVATRDQTLQKKLMHFAGNYDYPTILRALQRANKDPATGVEIPECHEPPDNTDPELKNDTI
jgi:signal transduction histidine kinase/DNA-binding response OmpR family regulator